MHDIQHWRIIFVNEHHHLLATLLVSSIDEVYQTIVCPFDRFRDTPFLFLFLQTIIQILFQLLLIHVLSTAHIEVKHWIFRPFFFQLFDGKSFEEFFLALKVALHRSDKERLTKTAWSSQEEISTAGMGHTIDIFRLVDIEFVFLTDSLKCLYAYRI